MNNDLENGPTCYEDDCDGGTCGDAAPCLTIGTTCDGPDAPAVSSDCGINSGVVRAWSSRPAGHGAPWASREALRVVCCDDCAAREEQPADVPEPASPD